MALAVVGLMTTAALSAAEPRPNDAAEWRIRLHGSGATAISIRPDGTDARKVEDHTPRGEPSPDGKQFLSVENDVIYLADAKGNRRLLAAGNDPHWSPDGKRVLYATLADGVRQVHVIPADSKDGAGAKRLSNASIGAQEARFLDDDRCIWLEKKPRTGKFSPDDLVLLDGGKTTKLVEDQEITSVSVSPDGKTIAYGAGGALVFLEPATNNSRIVKSREVHPDLDGDAFNIRWRPDGKAVLCQIHSMMYSRMDGASYFGDHELFTIPVPGQEAGAKATWLTLDPDLFLSALSVKDYRWERREKP
jgi:dipeptidyl aminopeptidase/acylaminoacyl peptidase